MIHQDPNDPEQFYIEFRYDSTQIQHGEDAGKWMGVVNLDDGRGTYFLRDALFDTEEEADSYAYEQGKVLVEMRTQALADNILKRMIHTDDD